MDVDPLEAPAADGQQPVVEYRAARPYLGVVRTVTWTGTAAAADRIPELFAHLTAHGVPPAGAPFLRYHRIAGEHELVVEAGVPVTECFFEGGVHGFMTMPVLELCGRARAQACAALSALLGSGSAAP